MLIGVKPITQLGEQFILLTPAIAGVFVYLIQSNWNNHGKHRSRLSYRLLKKNL